MVTTTAAAVRLILDLLSLEDSRRLLANADRRIFAAGLKPMLRERDTPNLYGWLMEVFSFQGISDAIAADYLARHGNAEWQEIDRRLRRPRPLCPKLSSFDAYRGCGFQKLKEQCNNPRLIASCPVPQLPLRKGQLNQLAFSLYLLIRDRAHGDLVGFIDDLLKSPCPDGTSDLVGLARDRLLKEFGQIYGVGPKLASMALASLLIAAGRSKPGWLALGRSFVVVDSLVHNFLHRTGILSAYGHSHAYGQACYGKAGCSLVLYKLAEAINLKLIEPRAPAYNPRLLQYVIWQFCAQTGLDICNGNHIDDRQACQRTDCLIGRRCPRLPLKPLGKAQRPSKSRGRCSSGRARRLHSQWRPQIGAPQAFQQGTLDSLCGLYAVINALRLAHRPFGPFGRERARALFAELVELTEARWGMANVIVDGYDDEQFRTLLTNGLKLARELTGRHYCQSFKAMGGFDDKRRNWLRSLERLTAHPATAVIVGIWGRMDHWSVLAGVSEQSLLFYDSDALKYLPLLRCSLTGAGKARRSTLHWLRVSGVIRCAG
jgi:hypothetical protein